MTSCPNCRRPVALARPTCLYCGAALPAEPAEAGGSSAADPGGRPEPSPARSLVVLELAGTDEDTLARALALPTYEAGLVVRRGGFRLHRVADAAAATEEAERLVRFGIRVFVVPEAEARVRPRRTVGGERAEGGLELRTEEGRAGVRRGDVLLVVKGPIAREYQPPLERRRVVPPRLEEGYRVHLHLRADAGGPADVPRPVELDPAYFEFGFAVTGSTRLELDAWVEAVRGNAAVDDGFRRLPPALGPAEPSPRGALAAAESLGRSARSGEDGPVLLDSTEQFRFYSGWRAAVERRRRPA